MTSTRSRSDAAAQVLWLAAHGPGQPRFPFRSEAAVVRQQRRRIAATIRYAYRNVSYYRETIDRLGLEPAEISTAADLARLPIIDRSDLQRDPERFVSRAHPIDYYIPLQTGGSTGAPVTVYHDPFALIRCAAYHQRAGELRRSVARRRFGCRTLSIGHESVISRRDTDTRLARLGRLVGARRRVVSILDPVERNLHEINRFRPHILMSFGSYLEELFVHLQASGEDFYRPSLVVYGGDAMSTSARALITETFGIPVLSGYGAYEALDLGFECTACRGHHINVDLYPTRLVDPGGRDVPAGERGEVVISNLVNRGTILLNYRLGDLAAWMPPCACGRTLPLLTHVQGRVADWLTMPSGERLHPQTVTVVLEVDPAVLRYQVVQTAPTRLIVKLVSAAGSSREALRQRVEWGFLDLFGPQIVTEVQFVDDLPRTAGGKVRNVVGLGTPV